MLISTPPHRTLRSEPSRERLHADPDDSVGPVPVPVHDLQVRCLHFSSYVPCGRPCELPRPTRCACAVLRKRGAARVGGGPWETSPPAGIRKVLGHTPSPRRIVLLVHFSQQVNLSKNLRRAQALLADRKRRPKNWVPATRIREASAGTAQSASYPLRAALRRRSATPCGPSNGELFAMTACTA